METEDVQAYADTFNAGNLDDAASYLSDDFQFSGPVPEPLNAAEYMGIMKTFQAAFPDIKFNLRFVSAGGNMAKTSNQLSGTHTGDLDLSAMGMGVIPATGKSFSIPEEASDVTVEGDKISSFHVLTQEGGGLMGILAQLGVQPPGA